MRRVRETKRLLDFCFLLYLNVLFSVVDFQRLTPLLRNIRPCESERGAERGGVGGVGGGWGC